MFNKTNIHYDIALNGCNIGINKDILIKNETRLLEDIYQTTDFMFINTEGTDDYRCKSTAEIQDWYDQDFKCYERNWLDETNHDVRVEIPLWNDISSKELTISYNNTKKPGDYNLLYFKKVFGITDDSWENFKTRMKKEFKMNVVYVEPKRLKKKEQKQDEGR